MTLSTALARALLVALLGLAFSAGASAPIEHDELDATLDVAYRAASDDARRLTVELRHPGRRDVAVAWHVDISDANGRTVRRWSGSSVAGDAASRAHIDWDYRDSNGARVPDGIYQAHLAAIAGSDAQLEDGLRALDVDAVLARPGERPLVQAWDMAVGIPPRAAVSDFMARLAVPAASNVLSAGSGTPAPYRIYYGNLHSQTNHSDGGGDLSTCNNAEAPQAGAYGPSDAFTYARDKGLDFLMASEHNHLYDGSTGSNANASAETGIALYTAGLDLAFQFNLQNNAFLALYGMEWGVTTAGGHLNILGAQGLYAWEYNASNQLIGNHYTPKSDYAALYTFMHAQQALGQFNHPASSGQFVIDGTALAYTADGDAVMVLAEVMNSSAFSVSTDETETSRTSYESVWKKLLERGFHVAPASNQDNHCANWGMSYTNRTGVLIPAEQALSATSFAEALRARRVFATMDRTAQILLTGADAMMGARISRGGSLPLNVSYVSNSGHVASQVQIYEGVPGRNGTVTLAASTASVTLTPSPGPHFYYAKITQDDGKLLWSAPLWVDQLDPADAIFGDGF